MYVLIITVAFSKCNVLLDTSVTSLSRISVTFIEGIGPVSVTSVLGKIIPNIY